MLEKNSKTAAKSVSLHIVEPYDFGLSLRAIRSFQPAAIDNDVRLRLPTRINGRPTLIEVSRGPGARGELKASSKPKADSDQILNLVEWVLFAELDLGPFYRLAGKVSKTRDLVKNLHGLKPMRTISLFEMAVIAITEQQISLSAAYHIRSRLVERFGQRIESQWIFPEPHTLANASLEDLRSCGLSGQKARYIHDFAEKVAGGSLDLDILKKLDDDKAREVIMNLRGFGRWSADYILIRGLGRPDCIPIDDIGVRSVVGEYLGDGRRVTPDEAAEKLEPFRPYRGLLAFYLFARQRLSPAGAK